MASKCPHCGCTEIEKEPARGDAICTSCGTVLSENNIVSEVQFLENARGSSSAIGQFVSSDSISKRPPTLRSYGTFSRESREITLGNAYKKIKGLCQQLRLNTHCIDTSFNFFKLALNKGMTRGRKNNLIVGACVYMTCRTESTAHMLIDVSDALQIDVYELGRTYLRLSTALCITIPAMDPCLYIYRFAHKLSFDKRTYEVSETALRLVKRMKRDWMHTGRRPSGLCGAALVIAARLHDFNRTILDVVDVVKVHESTLRKRLTEFGETPSSALTPEEFMTLDLEEEQDPPAFKAARKKEKEKLIDQQEDLLEKFSGIQKEIERHLEERKRKLRGIWAKYDKMDETVKEESQSEAFITESTIESINECIISQNTDELENKPVQGLGPSAASLGIKESIQECMEIRPSSPLPQESGVLDLTGIDDEEINSYILTEREIKFKTKLWMELNKEYLEEVKQKEEKEKQEAEEREKSGKPPKKRKAYKKQAKNTGPANTAGEAIEKMIHDKKLSTRINYDILRNLNHDESPSQSPKTESKSPLQTPITPVETPEGIQSVLHSLTGKKISDDEEEGDHHNQEIEKAFENALMSAKVNTMDDEMENEEEDEEEEEEDGLSTNPFLKRRSSADIEDDYDDYYD